MITNIKVTSALSELPAKSWLVDVSDVKNLEDILERVTQNLPLPVDVINNAMVSLRGIDSLHSQIDFFEVIQQAYLSAEPMFISTASGRSVSLEPFQKLAHHIRAVCPLSVTLVIKGLPEFMVSQNLLAEKFVASVLPILKWVFGANCIVVIPGSVEDVTVTDTQGLFAACLNPIGGESPNPYRSRGWQVIQEGELEYVSGEPSRPIEQGGGIYRTISVCHLSARRNNYALRFLMVAGCYYDALRGVAALLLNGDTDTALHHAKTIRSQLSFDKVPRFEGYEFHGVLNDDGELISIEVAYDSDHNDELIMFTHPSAMYGKLSEHGEKEVRHNATTAILSVGLMECLYLMLDGDLEGAKTLFSIVLSPDSESDKADEWEEFKSAS